MTKEQIKLIGVRGTPYWIRDVVGSSGQESVVARKYGDAGPVEKRGMGVPPMIHGQDARATISKGWNSGI